MKNQKWWVVFALFGFVSGILVYPSLISICSFVLGIYCSVIYTIQNIRSKC